MYELVLSCILWYTFFVIAKGYRMDNACSCVNDQTLVQRLSIIIGPVVRVSASLMMLDEYSNSTTSLMLIDGSDFTSGTILS